LEIVNSMQCKRLESSYLVNLSFRRTCSTCWTSLRMCNLWKLEFFRWWARSTPNGFGDPSDRNQPPPPPDPTIVATQTEMMRQILLYLQQQSQQ
jgi:hypothetical protein